MKISGGRNSREMSLATGAMRSMLHALGWRVAVVWECALKHSVEETAQAVEEWLHGDEDVLVIGQSID